MNAAKPFERRQMALPSLGTLREGVKQERAINVWSGQWWAVLSFIIKAEWSETSSAVSGKSSLWRPNVCARSLAKVAAEVSPHTPAEIMCERMASMKLSGPLVDCFTFNWSSSSFARRTRVPCNTQLQQTRYKLS